MRTTSVRQERVPSSNEASTQGFGAFFERESVRLLAALWLLTRNHAEAEEVLQEAFLKVWERWDRVSSLEDPAGYLYRTAMNEYRSRVRRAAVAVRKAVGAVPPDDAIARVEARETIVRALGTLTPRERAVVVVTDLLGYPPNDAGPILGIRPSTVRVLSSRAHARLRDEMGDTDA